MKPIDQFRIGDRVTMSYVRGGLPGKVTDIDHKKGLVCVVANAGRTPWWWLPEDIKLDRGTK